MPAFPALGCLRLITTGPAVLEPPLWMWAATGLARLLTTIA